MKLDRNEKGRGKYGLIKRRRIEQLEALHEGGGGYVAAEELHNAIALLERAGVIDWGDTVDSEFFVIRLRDRFARAALHAYAVIAQIHGQITYGNEVADLSRRAGLKHPNCKTPD